MNSKLCIMCHKEDSNLDFLGRCDACFRAYIDTPDHNKPDMGIPWSKKIKYN